jgi:hypothetical protein
MWNMLRQDRPIWVLLVVSVFVSSLYLCSIFDFGFVNGSSPYWLFPKGTIPGSENDMSQWLVSYLYLMKTPWSLPLLFTPNLNYPTGLVTFWCDPLPWLALAGRAIYSVTGAVTNLAGPYLIACFLLNGVAMTVLLATAGQRTVLAAAAGSLQAIATPFFMFRWGHISLMGQYIIIFGLALYLYSINNPYRFRTTAIWFVLLLLALLTSPYLLVMTAAVWVSSIYQPTRPHNRSYGGIVAELFVFMAAFGGVFYALGAFERHISAASAFYGNFSFNLLSPFIPQMSGVIWPASHYYMSLYEGFAYIGIGMLLLTAYSASAWLEWIRTSWRRHIMIAMAFVILLAVAVSNRAFAGRWEMFSFSLPDTVLQALGIVRSSGRFIWPIGYTLVAGTLILALRTRRRPAGVMVVIACTVIQLIDVEPLRSSIAASVEDHAPLVLDEAAVLPLIRAADAVLVFPSFNCIDRLNKPFSEEQTLRHANMELQLMAARNGRPINSVYTARSVIDCKDEDALRLAPLQPGRLYIYFDNMMLDKPAAQNFGPTDSCHVSASFSYCFVGRKSNTRRAAPGG